MVLARGTRSALLQVNSSSRRGNAPFLSWCCSSSDLEVPSGNSLSGSSVVAVSSSSSRRRHYFTNADEMKRDDPYAQLGLRYGDGATTAEIKAAFRERAAALHPDVNSSDPPNVAIKKFQQLRKAYETLVKVHSNLNGLSQEKDDEWRVSVWRNGDRIAVDRVDVAGAMKKRPLPAASTLRHYQARQLGHPSGLGISRSREGGEYLSSGGGGEDSRKRVSSSVGRGLNKWVEPKKYVPWKRE